jgi:outer membrane protein assembly factor BamB
MRRLFMNSSAVFVGINGTVIAIDRATGQDLWQTELKGSDFVNVILDGDRVLAATSGEIFCLDPGTGAQLWHNKLPNQGWGIASIATPNGSTVAGPVRKKLEQEQATSTVVVTG